MLFFRTILIVQDHKYIIFWAIFIAYGQFGGCHLARSAYRDYAVTLTINNTALDWKLTKLVQMTQKDRLVVCKTWTSEKNNKRLYFTLYLFVKTGQFSVKHLIVLAKLRFASEAFWIPIKPNTHHGSSWSNWV